MDSARHVIRSKLTLGMRVQNAFDDVASTIHQSLPCADTTELTEWLLPERERAGAGPPLTVGPPFMAAGAWACCCGMPGSGGCMLGCCVPDCCCGGCCCCCGTAPLVRGLHSSIFRVDVSTFCGIRSVLCRERGERKEEGGGRREEITRRREKGGETREERGERR